MDLPWNPYPVQPRISEVALSYSALVKNMRTLCETMRQMPCTNFGLMVNMDRKSMCDDGQSSDCLLDKTAIVRGRKRRNRLRSIGWCIMSRCVIIVHPTQISLSIRLIVDCNRSRSFWIMKSGLQRYISLYTSAGMTRKWLSPSSPCTQGPIQHFYPYRSTHYGLVNMKEIARLDLLTSRLSTR
jgi:hypothetical protein